MILSRLTNLFARLDDDETGEIPIGPLLVIGLIVIPLVIALIVFRDEILKWLKAQWDRVTGANTNATFK